MKYEETKNKLRVIHEGVQKTANDLAKAKPVKAIRVNIDLTNTSLYWESDWIKIAEMPDWMT